MKRIQLLISLGLASALLLAACGGDDDGSGADSGTTPGAGQTATNNTPTDGGTQPTNPPSDGGGGNAGDTAELEQLLRRLVDGTFKATFETVFENEGVEERGTMTLAQDPPRYSMRIESPDGLLGIFENEEGSFSCFGSDGFGQCSRGSLVGGSFFDIRDVAEDTADLATYRRIDDRTVNGRDSRCWQGTDSATNSETVVCLAKSGGFVTYVSGDGTEMTLQEYSDRPSDDDFELPFPVM